MPGQRNREIMLGKRRGAWDAGGSTSSRSPGLSDLGVWMRDDGSEHDPADDDGPGCVPVKPEHG